MNRRTLLKKSALAAVGSSLGMAALARSANKSTHIEESNFSYCLNTSTISGQNPSLSESIEIAARAGYDGIEIWMRDLQAYVDSGNDLRLIRKQLADAQLRVESAIGFATWIVPDPNKRAEAFGQMEEEMNLLAEIGCRRIAAPAAGVTTDITLDLLLAGERYAQLLELGRKTGVMPQLEFWGQMAKFHHLGQALMVAAAANDPDARILPDIFHLFRGGSDFNALKMLNGNFIEIFHLNDFKDDIPREKQKDKDRVYPGDGAAPLKQVLTDLKNMGGAKVLSLELFNHDYWKQDAQTVANTGLAKMKAAVASIG